jgi:nucleotide-binding universal stress UspA family protein
MADDSGRPDVVVAGVDGSAGSLAALSWASRYAEATGATVRAVLAWHYPAAAGMPPVGVAPAAVREETERVMNAQLADAIGKAIPASAAATAVEAKLGYGHPAEVLIDESKHADLLVVGSRGHGAFTGMLTGSISVHVVNHAECPVVVVRSP